ncbi:hypothetical protein KDM87_01855 [Undibacterium sp. FT147W]|uniref:Uncharacterized protein n=1 Tax=Undibacterium rivi TaxID=2828729 RepID=A0ABS5GYW1_9BURK|nr:hypothetical protein [Undibacterium rivi]MBR7791327.1 hypothetical protein [Undibacterium rivi]
MSEQLNVSQMICPIHGTQRVSFICHHLQYAENIGFYIPDEPPTDEDPDLMAWCSECEKTRIAERGWNDRSEAFANIIAICEGCFATIRARNA